MRDRYVNRKPLYELLTSEGASCPRVPHLPGVAARTVASSDAVAMRAKEIASVAAAPCFLPAVGGGGKPEREGVSPPLLLLWRAPGPSSPGVGAVGCDAHASPGGAGDGAGRSRRAPRPYGSGAVACRRVRRACVVRVCRAASWPRAARWSRPRGAGRSQSVSGSLGISASKRLTAPARIGAASVTTSEAADRRLVSTPVRRPGEPTTSVLAVRIR